MERLRIDKWLWAARFFKTRSLAAEQLEKGRVRVNGSVAKPSKEVKIADKVDIELDGQIRSLSVASLNDRRGPASEAALLFNETTDSRQRRLAHAELRRLAPEPAHSLTHGRPTKRDRRALDQASGWPTSK